MFFGRYLTLFIIGALVGENFAIKQIFPLLRILVIFSCIDSSMMSNPEPRHSWNFLALVDDGISALESLVLLNQFFQQVFWQEKLSFGIMDSHW